MNKLRILLNSSFKVESKKRFRFWLILVVWSVFLFLIFNTLVDFFQILNNIQDQEIFLVDRMLTAMFFILLLMLIFSGTTIALHFLFISSDLQLLLTAPVSRKTLFFYKYIEGTIANSMLFLFIGLPVVIAFGTAKGMFWGYYVYASLSSVVFLFIPTGFAILVTLIAVNLVPARRAKDFFAIIMALVFISVWAGLQYVRRSMFDSSSSHFNPEAVDHLKSVIVQPFLNWMPSSLFTSGLAAFTKHNWGGAALTLACLTTIAVVLVLISTILLEGAYRRELVGTEQLVLFKAVRRHGNNNARFTNMKPNNPLWSTMSKDFRLIFRDARYLSQILIFIIMMLVFPFVMKSDTPDLSDEWRKLYPFIFIFFIGAIISVQIASKLIPMESKAFLYHKLLPVPLSRTLWGKHLLAFTICSLISWIVIIVFSILNKTPISITGTALITLASVLFGACGLAILIGSLFPKFDWEHPKRMLKSSGPLILNLATIIFVGFSIGIIALFTWFIKTYLGINFIFAQIIGIMVSIIISIIVSVICIKLANHRLEKLEWIY